MQYSERGAVIQTIWWCKHGTRAEIQFVLLANVSTSVTILLCLLPRVLIRGTIMHLLNVSLMTVCTNYINFIDCQDIRWHLVFQFLLPLQFFSPTQTWSCPLPCCPQWPHVCSLCLVLRATWPVVRTVCASFSQSDHCCDLCSVMKARPHKYISKTCKLILPIKVSKVPILVNSVPSHHNWLWFVSGNQMQVMFCSLCQRGGKSGPGQVWIWWALQQTW